MQKFITIASIACLCMLCSCKSTTTGESTSSRADTISMNSSTNDTLAPRADPDPTDTIPAGGYLSENSDPKIAAMLAVSLDSTFKDELKTIPTDQRKFKYHAFDLDEDGKDEFMVALTGSYFCGTGGCTSYLFNHHGRYVSRFTVMDFPVYVAASSSEGWHDLIIKSGPRFHYMKMKAGKYPSNPSVVQVYKGDPPSGAPALLDIFEQGYPAFSF